MIFGGKNNITVALHASYFSMFLGLKIILKGHHFASIEIIQAESLVVQNILIEHNFQNLFKKNSETFGKVYRSGKKLRRE
jgi:hypothetical protein